MKLTVSLHTHLTHLYVAARRGTTRSRCHIYSTNHLPPHPSPTGLSKTSTSETLLPLAHRPPYTPSAPRSLSPISLQTTTRQSTKDRDKTRRPHDTCANFSQAQHQLRHLHGRLDPTTVAPLPKPHSAPHPPFRIRLRPQSASHFHTHPQPDHSDREQTRIAPHMGRSQLILSFH